ncbi:MAG TPA: hypothetical protein VFI23_15390 [Rhizomicrobium sp.]|nr:hypothetical protein [Rhizomicrobium sp.]
MRLAALPGVRAITLDQLEDHIPRLRQAKRDRDMVEYYFTCMAALHTYLFGTQPGISGTMYVDADIEFFANPETVFDAIGDAPVAVTPHNFVPQKRDLEQYGLFNGGWSAFRRTPEGLNCLEWWLEQSLAWCYNRVDGERYANQKYMNRFPQIAPATKILRQKGFNCAPWNIGNYKLTERDGRLWVDEEPLVFYHFHNLKRRSFLFEFPNQKYGSRISWRIRNKLYRPYIAELLNYERQYGEPDAAPADSHSRGPAQGLGGYFGKALRAPWASLVTISKLARNLPVIVLGSRVF